MPTPVEQLLEDLRRRRDGTAHNQLSVYVGNVTLDKLTDKERGRPLQHGDDSLCLGHDAASQLPLDRLEELFTADDWGPAWETFDSEQTEWYENDEGRIEAYNELIKDLEEIHKKIEDALSHVSWARTALDDPGAVFDDDIERQYDARLDPHNNARYKLLERYAIEQIDLAINILDPAE